MRKLLDTPHIGAPKMNEILNFGCRNQMKSQCWMLHNFMSCIETIPISWQSKNIHPISRLKLSTASVLPLRLGSSRAWQHPMNQAR